MRPDRDGDDKGFTLVEVMVAGTLLSVLALGLVNAWAVFDRLTFNNLMRQKAVFVLNGEMERLAAQYTTREYTPDKRIGYPSVPSLTDSSTRRTYSAADNLPFATNSIVEFQGSDTMVWLPGGTPPANWVWLDPARSLVANLSWVSCPVTDRLGAACWEGSGKNGKLSKCYAPPGKGGPSDVPCLLVTVVLTYPYKLAQGSAAPVGATSTLTLSTIVGQRRG